MPLLIQTHLKEIPLKGIGLIASEYIHEGKIVYEDNIEFDRVITQEQVDKMSECMQNFIHTYCSFNKESNTYYVCMDNSRFLNHSFTPNLKWHDDKKIYTAIKEINIGEELTCNYTEFDDPSKEGNFGFEIH